MRLFARSRVVSQTMACATRLRKRSLATSPRRASGAHVEQRQAAVPRKVRDETLHVTQGQPCSAEEGIEARDVVQVLREVQEGPGPVDHLDGVVRAFHERQGGALLPE